MSKGINTKWSVLTHLGEFELFDTEAEALAFQKDEIGDGEGKYSQAAKVYLMSPSQLRTERREAFEAGRCRERWISEEPPVTPKEKSPSSVEEFLSQMEKADNEHVS